MVTDRTQADVDYANAHRDSAEPLKGRYNYTDLNRVEAKVAELQNFLQEYGYFGQTLTTKIDWGYTDKFKPTDASRYLSNIQQIRNAISVKSTTPNVPGTMRIITYSKANDIEQILVDVETLLNNMLAEFRYSNTFYSGESEGLF